MEPFLSTLILNFVCFVLESRRRNESKVLFVMYNLIARKNEDDVSGITYLYVYICIVNVTPTIFRKWRQTVWERNCGDVMTKNWLNTCRVLYINLQLQQSYSHFFERFFAVRNHFSVASGMLKCTCYRIFSTLKHDSILFNETFLSPQIVFEVDS